MGAFALTEGMSSGFSLTADQVLWKVISKWMIMILSLALAKEIYY